MNARDRVKLCIEQARNHSGETALRALTNAVEILADQLKDEHVGTYYPPMIAEIKTQDEPGDRTHDSAPNAADALRRARARIEAAPVAAGACRIKEGALAIIDDEIAKLGAAPASNAATPKLFVAENALRGSYFCTEFLFRPFLHIGRYIEFDDIPRILKLGRNDVIEIRVVERAKQ